MFSRSVGALTTCALGASAFLIPAGIKPVISEGSAGPFDLSLQDGRLDHEIVRLPCPSCAFGNKEIADRIGEMDEDLFWIQGGAYDILLNFTLSEGRKVLEVNGAPIFPLGLSFSTAGNWKAYQVPSFASLKDIEAGKVDVVQLDITGGGIGVTQEDQLVGGHIYRDVLFGIHELNEVPMHLDEVHLPLMELREGDESKFLMLGFNIEAAPEPQPAPVKEVEDVELPEDVIADEDGKPFPVAPWRHNGPPPWAHEECGSIPGPICHFKHMLEAKINGMRHGSHDGKRPACTGRKGGRPMPGSVPGHIKGPMFPVDGESDSRPDGPHHGHHHHHGGPLHMGPPGWKHHSHNRNFLHSFVKGFLHVLVYLMAGAAVGLTLGFVSAMIGHLVSMMWFKFARGGRRGYVSLSADEPTGVAEQDEKEFLTEPESPPAYVDAPVYEAVEKE